MVLTNAKIVLTNKVIERGYVVIFNNIIKEIGEGDYKGSLESYDLNGLTLFPGFIDVHVHGSSGIDFMDANKEDYKTISNSLYLEGVTTYLATTLTASFESLKKVSETIALAVKENPSLYGLHLEGPYISLKYKGAQNEQFIRDPNIDEFNELNKASNGNIRYISLASEKDGAMEFIKYAANKGVVISCGHSDASFSVVEEAIKNGLTNITHTHNAMSPHHHRNPGVVTAAMYFDKLNCECICDRIHVCDDTLRMFYKIVGEDRFMIITDALKIKNSNINEFELYGLQCERKNGAAYLKSGALAGSLLTMNKGVKNMKEVCNLSLCELAKISSLNAAKSLHLLDRGEIKEGKLADLVVMNDNFDVIEVYKLGRRVK